MCQKKNLWHYHCHWPTSQKGMAYIEKQVELNLNREKVVSFWNAG